MVKMTKISANHKQTISELYVLCITATDTGQKVSLYGDLYASIKAALTIENKLDTSTTLTLAETRSKLSNAWKALGSRLTWPGAAQDLIIIGENIALLGFREQYIDVSREQWSITGSYRSPEEGDN